MGHLEPRGRGLRFWFSNADVLMLSIKFGCIKALPRHLI